MWGGLYRSQRGRGVCFHGNRAGSSTKNVNGCGVAQSVATHDEEKGLLQPQFVFPRAEPSGENPELDARRPDLAAHRLRCSGAYSARSAGSKPNLCDLNADLQGGQKASLSPNWIRRGSKVLVILPKEAPLEELVFGGEKLVRLKRLKTSVRNCKLTFSPGR